MMIFDSSIWRIVLAVVVYWGVGAAWYSPALFSKPWMKALGKKKDDIMGDPTTGMIGSLLSEVIIVIGLAYMLRATGVHGWADGATLGVAVWALFSATTALINGSFQNMPIKLYVIDQGYHLVGFLLASAILAY